MKIEKGKLYYNHQLEGVIIAVEDSEDKSGILSDKIAVHCPTKEDWDYIVSKGYNLYKYWGGYIGEPYFIINSGGYVYLTNHNINDYHTITINQFKEFYPEKGSDNTVISDKINDSVQSNEQKVVYMKDSSQEIDELHQEILEMLESKFKDKEEVSDNTDTADNTNPIHYNTKGIQPIDYIEANDMNFNEGNVVKYVTRYKEKNGLEDLKKARVYLQRLIDKYDKK